MTTEVRDFADALEQVEAALAAMGSGNPEPYANCWAESEDVTLFGAARWPSTTARRGR